MTPTPVELEKLYRLSQEWREEIIDLLTMLEEMGRQAKEALLLSPSARADADLVQKLSFVERKIQMLLRMKGLPHRA